MQQHKIKQTAVQPSGQQPSSHAVTANSATPQINLNIPNDGMSRFKQIQAYLPVSRETWRKMVKAKKAPQPIVFSARCVMFKNSEVKRFLSDPLNYRAEVAA